MYADEQTLKFNNKADSPKPGLADLDRVFARWFGSEYDLDAIHATLACAAAIRLDGDPVWLLLVSGPGNAKTETVGYTCASMGSSADGAAGGLLLLLWRRRRGRASGRRGARA